MAKRIKVNFRILPDGPMLSAKAQEGRTLLFLHAKASRGVVAFDFRGGPPFLLPAHTWSLKRKFGLNIETRRELHDGGWHGCFVMHTAVEIAE